MDYIKKVIGPVILLAVILYGSAIVAANSPDTFRNVLTVLETLGDLMIAAVKALIMAVMLSLVGMIITHRLSAATRK